MDGVAAAAQAEVHHVDHDAGRHVAHQVRHQHQHECLGDARLVFAGDPLRLRLFHSDGHPGRDHELVADLAVDSGVGHEQNEQRQDDGRVDEHESVGDVADLEVDERQRDGNGPDGQRLSGHDFLAVVFGPIVVRRGDGDVAVDGESGQAEHGRRTGHEVRHVDAVDGRCVERFVRQAFLQVNRHGNGLEHQAYDQVRERQVHDEEVERRAQLSVRILVDRQAHEQITTHRHEEERERHSSGEEGQVGWGQGSTAVSSAERHGRCRTMNGGTERYPLVSWPAWVLSLKLVRRIRFCAWRTTGSQRFIAQRSFRNKAYH